tara:strand:- start:537 stop:881 length:345 start_codon:yes stop_codon:yes gene_type:complete
MAKGDYTDSTTKTNYRTMMATNSDSKVTVASNEKRDRAELLDMVEELFQSADRHITAEKLRAFCHILIKSVQNASDDTDVDLGASSTAGSLPTSDPRVAGRLWNSSDTVKVSRG